MANFHKNGQFVTNNYKKSIFNGVFTNYETFIPMYQTRVLLHTLLHRRFSICYHFKTFHVQMDHLKAILMKKKKWSPNFINSCIKSFVNNLYTPKVIVQNVPKTNVFVTLLFSESTSCQIWKKSFKNHLVINWDLLIKKSS